MKDLRMRSLIIGLGLFISGVLVSYMLIATPDHELISQIFDEEFNKRSSHFQGMRGQSDIEKKVARIESSLNSLLSATEQGTTDSIGESNLTLSILAKLNALEKQINSFESGSSNNTVAETSVDSNENNGDPLKSLLAEDSSPSNSQGLEQDFQTEEQDPQWSVAVNDKIKNALEKIRQDSNISSSIIAMDCKTTLCRVELTYDDKEDMGLVELNLMDSLHGEIEESSSNFVKDSDGNTSSIVYYFARKGHSVARSSQNVE